MSLQAIEIAAFLGGRGRNLEHLRNEPAELAENSSWTLGTPVVANGRELA